MAMDGVIADKQSLCNRLIVQTLGDQPQDLDLALSQLATFEF